MTDEAKKLYDELKPEQQREFKTLLAHDAKYGKLTSAVNVCVAYRDYANMQRCIEMAGAYETELLTNYYEAVTSVQTSTISELGQSDKVDKDDHQRLKLLADLAFCYANLLDSTFIDLASMLHKLGYYPQTAEIFNQEGKKLRKLVREEFGEQPLEWADDFDDICQKADEMVRNKIQKFLRSQERKENEANKTKSETKK